MKKIILCLSDSVSGREKWTGPISTMPENFYERIVENELSPSIYKIDKGLWHRFNRGKPNYHASHYLTKNGEELCAGDYI